MCFILPSTLFSANLSYVFGGYNLAMEEFLCLFSTRHRFMLKLSNKNPSFEKGGHLGMILFGVKLSTLWKRWKFLGKFHPRLRLRGIPFSRREFVCQRWRNHKLNWSNKNLLHTLPALKGSLYCSHSKFTILLGQTSWEVSWQGSICLASLFWYLESGFPFHIFLVLWRFPTTFPYITYIWHPLEHGTFSISTASPVLDLRLEAQMRRFPRTFRRHDHTDLSSHVAPWIFNLKDGLDVLCGFSENPPMKPWE